MSTTAKITFLGDKPATPVNFVSWKGRPQLPQPLLDYTTRLGGSQLIISNIKKESVATQVSAVLVSNAFDVAASIRDLNEWIKSLQDNIGKRCTWTDENGVVIERVYITNLAYNIKIVGGGAKAMADVQMTIMVDETPSQVRR